MGPRVTGQVTTGREKAVDPLGDKTAERNGNSFSKNQLLYSTDGISFTEFGTAFDLPIEPFDLRQFDLSTVDVLDGKPSVYLRIVLDGADPPTGGKFASFDNIQINASAVPAPGTFCLMAIGGSLLLTVRPWRRRRDVQEVTGHNRLSD